jgi:hypothetical protein
LLHVERLREGLLAELTAMGLRVEPVELVADPALGAMRLAAQAIEPE